jgi:hypothetical protein
MTRMWVGVDPAALCDDHLLGEHSEMHQEVGTWLRHPHGGAVVRGHVEEGQVVPDLIRERHGMLAGEMAKRGMDHDSPLEDFDPARMPALPRGLNLADVVSEAREDLADRCPRCSARLEGMSAVR